MKRLSLIIWGALLLLAGWSFGFEPGWLQQRQLTLAVENWSGPPLKIAVAADLHVGAPHAGLPMLRTDVVGVPRYGSVPSSMTNHGVCQG